MQAEPRRDEDWVGGVDEWDYQIADRDGGDPGRASEREDRRGFETGCGGLARRTRIRWLVLDWLVGDRRGDDTAASATIGTATTTADAGVGRLAAAIARGGFSLVATGGRVGRGRERGGWSGGRGRDARGGVGLVATGGSSGRDARRGVRTGARREGEAGSRFISQTGCCEDAGATATATATARATGQDGDRQRQHQRGDRRRLLQHRQQRRPRRRQQVSEV